MRQSVALLGKNGDFNNLPSGKHRKNYGKSQFLMGYPLVNFKWYVSMFLLLCLPEGNQLNQPFVIGNESMGDLQHPIYGGTLVPYVWPYELWGYSLKFRPAKIGQKYMESVPPINRFLKWPCPFFWATFMDGTMCGPRGHEISKLVNITRNNYGLWYTYNYTYWGLWANL